tara:strand:+ start:170 stop:397 length:228 start_codon:yes stop_codon:yes gene_type:complete
MNRLKRIHVNRHTLAHNKKHKENNPPIGIEESGYHKRYAHSVTILGPSTVIHNEERPLKCGARVWIETRANLKEE